MTDIAPAEQIQGKRPLPIFRIILTVGCSTTLLSSYLPIPAWIAIIPPVATVIYLAYHSLKVDSIDRDVESLNHHAEQTYLLGYLLTLLAILGVALASGSNGDFDGLLKAAAVKLLASLAGITAMLLMKEVSHQWEAEQTLKQDHFEQEIGKRITRFDGDLQSVTLSIQAIEKIVNIDFLNQTADMMRAFYEKIKASSHDVGLTIDKLSQTVDKQINMLSQVSENFTEAQNAFRIKNDESLNTFQESIDYTLTELNSSHNEMLKFVNDSHTDMANIVTSNVSELSNSTKLLIDHSDGLKNSLSSVSDIIVKLKSNAELITNTSLSENLVKLEGAIKNISIQCNDIPNINERLSTATGNQLSVIKEYSEVLSNASDATSLHQTNMTQLINEAQAQIKTLLGSIEPERNKLEKSADYIQDTSEKMATIQKDLEKLIETNSTQNSGLFGAFRQRNK